MKSSSPSIGADAAAEAMIGDGKHYVIMGRPESGYSMKVSGCYALQGNRTRMDGSMSPQ